MAETYTWEHWHLCNECDREFGCSLDCGTESVLRHDGVRENLSGTLKNCMEHEHECPRRE